MTLITEKVRENAEKCRECIIQKVRDMADKKSKIEWDSILHKNNKLVADAISKLSCNLCPNKKDFEKVYGMSPFDYYTQNQDALKP